MTGEPPDERPVLGAAAFVAFVAFVACPIGVPIAAAIAWRARRRVHETRRLLVLGGCGFAFGLMTLWLTRRWYAAAWGRLLSAVVSGHHHLVSALAALGVMAPASLPLGFGAGLLALVALQAQAERHPLRGREARERRLRLAQAAAVRDAGQPDGVPMSAEGAPVLGVWLGGDQCAEWKEGRWAVLPESVAHVVALGATGSGKTETVLRLATAHLELGWRVLVVDAKEDPEPRERFGGLATARGLAQDRVKLWPGNGPLDLCRGDAAAQKDRWMACAAWSEPYYRSVAATVLSLTCYERTGAPTTPGEFLSRLDGQHLKSAWAGTANGPVAAALSPQDVQGVRYRYFTLVSDLERAGAIPAAEESAWGWEDADAAWVTLPTATRPELAGAFGRAALVDLIGYFRDPTRRTTRRPILLIIEEMGAITSADEATAAAVVEAVERSRSAGVRCVVSAQTPEGLGTPPAQDRLLHGGAAVLAHRMANPEPVVRLLGTQLGWEASLGVDAGGNLGEFGSVREQHQWRVPPDIVRRLPVGQAICAHAGRWLHVAVARTPSAGPATHTPERAVEATSEEAEALRCALSAYADGHEHEAARSDGVTAHEHECEAAWARRMVEATAGSEWRLSAGDCDRWMAYLRRNAPPS
jgi:hypothetical protein